MESSPGCSRDREKKSTPPQPGLGKGPAEFRHWRAEEMPEEELLDVQKTLTLGGGRAGAARSSALGIKS